MKKLILSLMLVLSCYTVANAQFYIGGAFGFSVSGLDLGFDEKQSGASFKLLPEVGYKINKDWSVGLSLGFMKGFPAVGAFDPSDIKALGSAVISTVADVSSDDMMNMDVKTFRFAPFSRYTLWSHDRFEVFVDGVLAVNFLKVAAEADLGNDMVVDDSQKVRGFEITFRPGVSFALNKHIKLNAKIGALGYQHLNMVDQDFKLNRFGLDVDGTNLLFGMLYTF